MPSLSARDYVQAKRAGRATSVRVAPTGTAVEQYQVSLGNRHSLKEAGVVGLPSWSEKQTQTETWVKVPRLSALCPRRVVVFDGGKGNIDKTMEFGDDFDGTGVDTAKWTAAIGSGGAVAVGAGAMRLTETANAETRIISIRYFGENTRTVTRYKVDHVDDGYIYEEFGVIDSGGTKSAKLIASHDVTTRQSILNSDATYSFTKITGGLSEGTYFRAQLIRATTARWKIDDRAEQTYGTNYPNGALMAPWLRVYGNPAGLTVDHIFVTKWVAAEPLAGTAKPTATNRALSRPLNHAGLIRAVCA